MMLQFLTSCGSMSRVVGPAALVPQYNYVQTQWGMYPQNAGLLQQTLPQAGQTTPQGQVLRGQTPRSLTPSQTEGLGTPTGSVQSQLHTPGACVNRIMIDSLNYTHEVMTQCVYVWVRVVDDRWNAAVPDRDARLLRPERSASHGQRARSGHAHAARQPRPHAAQPTAR